MYGIVLALTLLSNSNYQVVWENTKIDIALLESVYDYDDLPSAKLIINGIERIDDKMYYEKGVDRTSLSVVNTNYVKEYHVNYQVIFPSYGVKHTISIAFNVIDNIKPTIVLIPTLKYPLQTKTIEYLQGLEYYDNYYTNENIKVNVLGKEQVKTTTIGKFPITYQIIDGSNNVLEINSVVEIYDDIAPTIIQKKDININPNEAFNYSSYIEIKDNYDAVLKIEIDDANINYQVIGTYILIITATDKSNNVTKELFTIKIADTISPEIVLVSTIPEIEVADETALNSLDRYCLNVSDNYDAKINIRVSFLHDIDIKTVGTYEVIFEAIDTSHNLSTKKLKIKVVDTTKPTIMQIKELVLEVFQEKPNFHFFFEFADNYSNTDDLKINISEKVNINKIGFYELIVTATDESKNKRESLFFVRVIDSIPPTVILDKDIIITDFYKKEYENYLTITDNLDKAFIIEVDDSKVNYSEVGIYELTITIKDLSNNETIIVTEVIICDIEPPAIILNQDVIFLDVFANEIDYLSYIFKLEDNYDQLQIADIKYYQDINYDIVGKYEVLFQAFDSLNNYKEATLIVFIDDYTPPAISVFLPKSTNKMINLYDYVSVIDNYDGDITGKVEVNQTNIEYSKNAIYEIKYYCQDSRGNYCEETVELAIKINASNDFFVSLIPYVIVFVVSSAIIVFIYIKKYKKSL